MSSSGHIKALGLKDVVLFTVSAILLLDTLAAGAAVGASAVFWWLFLGVVFFIPYALICAELGTAYPEQGGLYAWIRRAYGRRWASRAAWRSSSSRAVRVASSATPCSTIQARMRSRQSKSASQARRSADL